MAIYYLEDHYVVSRIQDFDIREKVYYSVLYTMLVLPIGMIFMNLLFKFKPEKEWNAYRQKKTEYIFSKNDNPIILIISILVLINLLVLFYVIYNIGTLPLLEAFKVQDSSYLSKVRQESSRFFSGNQLVKNLLGIEMSIITSYVSYAYYKINKTNKTKILLILTIIVAIVYQTLDLSKAPILWYILGFVMIKVLIDGKLKKKQIYLLSGVLISVIFISYTVLGMDTDINLNQGPVGRVFLSQIAPLFHFYMIFPEIVPFLQPVNESGESAARIVMTIVNPSGVEQGLAGVMNTLFIGEAYAHYGMKGILLIPFMVGMIIQGIYIFFIRKMKTPLSITLFVIISLRLQMLITGGFLGYLYNPGIIYFVLMMLAIIISAQILRITVYKKENII